MLDFILYISYSNLLWEKITSHFVISFNTTPYWKTVCGSVANVSLLKLELITTIPWWKLLCNICCFNYNYCTRVLLKFSLNQKYLNLIRDSHDHMPSQILFIWSLNALLVYHAGYINNSDYMVDDQFLIGHIPKYKSFRHKH